MELANDARKPTQREKLMAKKNRLTVQLQAVNSALNMLDSHPDLEEFIKVIGQAGI